MKLAKARLRSFLAAPDPGIRAALLYGPDGGQVQEHARALVRAVAGDVSDPFRVADITGAALEKEARTLWDEASAISMTGGARAVRVRSAGDRLGPLFKDFLADPPGEAFVVVEAGELGGASSLRRAFESANCAVAIACYLDEADDLFEIVGRALAEAKVGIHQDALAYAVEHLGGDRGVTRQELAKLVLYGAPGAMLTVDDVKVVLGDSAEITIDDLVFAVGGGEQASADRALARCLAEGASPIGVLRALGRHFDRLHRAAAQVATGMPAAKAAGMLRPPLFFRRRDAFIHQLQSWNEQRLGQALAILVEAELQCKSTGMPDAAVCARTVMRLAAAGRR